MTLKEIYKEVNKIMINYKYGNKMIYDYSKSARKMIKVINHKLKDKRLSDETIDSLRFSKRILRYYAQKG